MSKRQIILKVFSGPHAGAEIPLGCGTHTIGSGEECDIILDDQALAETHAELVIEDRSVRCRTAHGQAMVIDGERIEDSQLDDFQFVALGNTYVAVGPDDRSWPNLTCPDFDPSGVPSGTDADSTCPEEGSEAREGTEEDVDDSDAKEAVAPNRTQATVLACLLVMLFVAAGIGNLVFPSEPEESEATPVSSEQIDALIAEIAPDGEIKVTRREGILFVEGFVSTKKTERNLESRLKRSDRRIEVRIRNSDGLADATQTILDMYKLKLTTRPGPAGEVFVEGETDQVDVWEKAEATILRDVPLRALNGDDVVLHDLQEMPVEATALVSQTTLPLAEKTEAPPVRRIVPPAREVDLKIRSVCSGEGGAVTLENGHRVFQNGFLNGHQLVEIEPHRLIVLVDGVKEVWKF